MKGRIILYTGGGEGKTTSAIGHAVRATGQGKMVVIIQFMKGRKDTGEFKFLKGVENIKVHLCGAPDFLVNKKNRDEHLKKVKEGLTLAERVLDRKECDLLILDEVLYALKFKLIEKRGLLSLLDKRGEIDIIITGREPSKELQEMSDVITEMQNIKHHYDEDKKTIRGLDY
ncbi:MAG: cob(I)yrinic acid a,c-diamide adenosyltransferase [Candidatus Hydrothermarchaeales archaeon]